MKIIAQKNMTPKDFISAQNGATLFKDIDEKEIILTKAAIFENNKGNVMTVLGDKDGTYYSGISATMADTLDTAINLLSDEEFKNGIPAVITTGTSNAGRPFKYIIF